MTVKITLGILSLFATTTTTSAFTPQFLSIRNIRPSQHLFACNVEDNMTDRRGVITRSISVLGGILAVSRPSSALAYPQEKQDKEKIVKGYKRLSYLINNWEKETVICGRGDNPYVGCERHPEKVMEYLGYKSIEDPLYRADKLLMRLSEVADDSKYSEYSVAMDKYVEAAEDSNGQAFVSSWGEANPGGGKDAVERYIEKSKSNLIIARNSLGKMVDLLGLEK